ncbi:DNA mismatch endonuclease Vsr [Oryzomonas sagensis]|uniref:Very short patch repair endonuclease n=2 Tax=Oryzomonas sagensis TaxID=2603857 RepID=A0ABQ6TQH3_9BACT|nr:DNA mismatch endonuclease Vsr [Oryzomonas sagensis]
MDRLTPERRSWLMSRVKAKNTSPEMVVRRLVYGMGYRYRIHVEGLPGKPDLVFAGSRKAIYVNGCFWHGHEGCRYAGLPKSRVAFWAAKIARNRARDRENVSAMEADGWRVLTIWQCELKNREKISELLHDFLKQE